MDKESNVSPAPTTTWAAAWNNDTLTKRLRYIYNGYVQIAEIDATNEDAPQVAKTFLWDPIEPVATRISFKKEKEAINSITL